MSTVTGWSFLVARGTRKGYRSVLAPDFMVQDRRHDLLVEQVGGSAAEGQTAVQHLVDDVLGNLTITYRVEPALADELTNGGTAHGQPVLLDEHSRPLELMYGLVTTSRVRAGDRDMTHARGEAVASYRRFLADEDGVDVQESAPLPLLDSVPVAPPTPPSMEIVLVGATSATNERPEVKRDPRTVLPAVRPVPREERTDHAAAPHHSLRPRLLAVLALAAAVVLGGTAIGSIRGKADEVTVTVHNPPDRQGTDGLPTCEDVHIAGVIAADGPVTVDYQWTVDGLPAPASQSHTFVKADQITIDSPADPGANVAEQDRDGTVTRSYELVVSRHDRENWHGNGVAKVHCALNGGIDAAAGAVAVRVQEVDKAGPDTNRRPATTCTSQASYAPWKPLPSTTSGWLTDARRRLRNRSRSPAPVRSRSTTQAACPRTRSSYTTNGLSSATSSW